MQISEINSTKAQNDFEFTKEQGGEETYTFERLGDKFEGLKDLQTYISKWGLRGPRGVLKAENYRYSFKFNEINPDPFFVDFFNSQEVRNVLDFVIFSGFYYEKVDTIDPKCTKVSYNKLKSSLLNLDIFDKLEERQIVVSESKLIKGQFEEEIRGVKVDDKLRDCLVNEESENYDLFTADERKEFLVRLFSHFVLGSSMCQPEDKVIPYLETTKTAYKALLRYNFIEGNNFISAKKDANNQIFLESLVYEITKINDKPLFKDQENPQNCLYLIISPSLRQVVLFGNKWIPFWQGVNIRKQ